MEVLLFHYRVSAFLHPITHTAILLLLVCAMRRGIPVLAAVPLAVGHLIRLVFDILQLITYLQVQDGSGSGVGVSNARMVLETMLDWFGDVTIVMGWFVFLGWLVGFSHLAGKRSQETGVEQPNPCD